MSDLDTIFAAASGAGRAAITVVRISGSAAPDILIDITGGRLPLPRAATVRRLRDHIGQALDRAIVLWLPGPSSYTGEDSAELHLHGGAAVLEGVSLALSRLGARPAEPGEFTRRAFLNGRMELTEAEAVADLVEAETSAQRDQALQQINGALGQVFDALAADLKAILAEQEALIDFPEETATVDGASPALRDLIHRIETQLVDDHGGERLREGLVFAIVGPPNVGKSSLLNALAEREAAIVAPTAGTTRDVVEVRTVFGGVPVTLLDTAGLRQSDDPVEAEGVRRARARAASASLVIAVQQAGSRLRPPLEAGWLHVASKIDLAAAAADVLGVSVVSGAGLTELRERLDCEARKLTQQSGPAPLTRARHRAACQDAVHHLRDALSLPNGELRAEEIRLAMAALGRVTGRVGVEEVLGEVFSRFCIGK